MSITETCAALREFVGDVAEGPGAVWPAPSVEEFYILVRAFGHAVLHEAGMTEVSLEDCVGCEPDDPCGYHHIQTRIDALGRTE